MERRELIYNAKTGEETIIVREMTEEEIALDNARQAETQKNVRIAEIQQRLTALTKDDAQRHFGLIIPDYEEKKAEFQRLLNEIRVLEGKEPREIDEVPAE